ncbi:hypothetical protein, conserved [Leishmania braziliensis MHOM/BR/75/M2904]|uniref:Uncharacterized protein n=1 Tax=Leishmania braziliensis TaxID=5660 RepID=A4HC46_LEIBR|nr:hypothetical protein, conserved [Leishmania braziliensis MHOM/BR/75/M2904]KAI5690074.1 hypothetical protein MNV84_00922 [Leishmania braziliensis]KAI5690080.1 hypothetical protein MNV84_00933 [Leishmania braziliensis]CAJ2467082.1 unnamed protein product [Leishmania braziliensis]CAJ2467872.1 unnamed protein product [Leishmania braziliensis]CAM38993.1 hypothetical protein, conserved [Leishmania braziliensis MHOM/BR/75/M2904]
MCRPDVHATPAPSLPLLTPHPWPVPMTKLAVVCRAVPSALEKQTCKLTRIERQTISLPIVPEQHRAYVQVFKDMIEEGHSIELPELSELPASMFVEDVSMLYSVCAVAPPGGGLDSGHGEGSALGEQWHSGTAHCWRRRRAVRFEFEVHVCEQVDALERRSARADEGVPRQARDGVRTVRCEELSAPEVCDELRVGEHAAAEPQVDRPGDLHLVRAQCGGGRPRRAGAARMC